MACLLIQASSPRPKLVSCVSQQQHCRPCRGRFLSPRIHLQPRALGRLALELRMAEMARFGGDASPEVAVSAEDDAMLGGEESPSGRQRAARWASVEATLNRMSKWLVAGCFSFAALWKHDFEIMWILLGAIVNSLLSKILKKMLNHERPAPALRADPGMPSSHAQSFFFAATILALSLFYWIRPNYLAMILGSAVLSAASYLSWLRVSQGLHTLNQVIVGASVGSALGALWFVLWHSLVQDAIASSLLLRIAVVLGSAAFCVAFIIHVIRDWLKEE